LQVKVCREVKITIGAGLFAKGNMNIDACHWIG
jgi:hypothetical protein